MSGNPAKELQAAAADVERHIELVQPRRVAEPEERQKIKEKIKVRAASRKVMAQQQIKAGASSKKRESRLIPADGGGMSMGMGMQTD